MQNMAPNPTYSALVTDEPNQMVQVAAPATLPEGYHFEASFEGNVFTVAVVRSENNIICC